MPELPDTQGAAITEHLVAEAFTRRYTDRMAYCHSRGAWLSFNGYVWRQEMTPIAFHYARQLSVLMANGTTGTTQHKSSFAAGVERMAKADPALARTASDWDRDPWLLGTPEGTVDLKSGDMRESVPSEHISKSTAISPDLYIDCPRWLRFLKECTNNDADLQRYLQQISGYVLTGDISEQILFFIYGKGGSGKGTFLNTIQAIMADYKATAPMSVLEKTKGTNHPTDIAMMDGARLVTAQETEQGGTWNQQTVTSLTGGDPITARYMHMNNFTFQPLLKLVIIGNFAPSLKTVEDAMKRRLKIIPFKTKPVKKDLGLGKRLESEWPGILRWMIEGCLDWQKNGLIEPRVVTEETAKYFEDQDAFGQWIKQDCRVEFDNDSLWERSASLFKSWQEYAKANALEAGDSKTFAENMERNEFPKRRMASGQMWRHIELIRHVSTDDDQGYLTSARV